jgi:hypothetical protein
MTDTVAINQIILERGAFGTNPKQSAHGPSIAEATKRLTFVVWHYNYY